MPARKYTDEQMAKALALYESDGVAEAAAQTGIPRGTISSWARRSGMSTVAPENIRAAIEMASLSRDEKRVKLQDLILDKALDMLGRMDEPHKDFKVTKEGIEEVKFDKATSGDCKNYGTTAAILLDKFRLEMGEATSRSENLGRTEKEGELANIIGIGRKSA